MKTCNSCGKCCKTAGNGGLSASAEEIDWWETYRPDIARYVQGRRIWIDPATDEYFAQCPWLQQSPDGKKFTCEIYDDRPEDCRHYPVDIAQMVRDDCEMLEQRDLVDSKRAQRRLDEIMADSRPPMGGRAWMTPILGTVSLLLACSASSPTALAATSKLQQSFNDTDFVLNSCELKIDRTVICQMTVHNRYTDKRIEITKAITIQDDLGNEYPVTAGGFGNPSTGSKWNQIAVADSTYKVYVVAPNVSSQATSVRAVVFPRLLVRSAQGQTLGYRDRVVFARPPMVEAEAEAEVAAEVSSPPAPETPPADAKITSGEEIPIAIDEWQVVGLWSYDGEDGQHIPAQGFVLLAQAGAGVGQAWLARLELKNHDQLPERNRALWPVMIHIEQRQVCADYPDYPTYPVFIDMPGIDEDAVYTVSGCKAE